MQRILYCSPMILVHTHSSLAEEHAECVHAHTSINCLTTSHESLPGSVATNIAINRPEKKTDYAHKYYFNCKIALSAHADV